MSKLVIAVSAAAMLAAFAFPAVFERYNRRLAEEHRHEAVVPHGPATVEAAAPAPATPPPLAPGRTTVLTASSDGHFRTEARLNGRSLPVLVDTGATVIAMSEANARRLGVRLAASDFRHTMQTANGEAAVAAVTLGSVEIGRVTVRDVEAIVAKGDSLPVTLLGMSFLGKLKRFGVEGERLTLVQ